MKEGFFIALDILLENAVIVTPLGETFGSVAISNGKILSVGRDLVTNSKFRHIDLEGAYLLPGGIDAHTHFDMLAGSIRTSDDFYSGTKAAIAGGTTSIIDFAEPDLNAPLSQGLSTWHSKADDHSFCDYGFHMTITHWDDSMANQMLDMKNKGVSSFKLYTAYHDMRVSDDVIYNVLKTSAKLGTTVCVHCENGDLLDALTAEKLLQNPTDISLHPLTRPPLVEAEAVSRVIQIARLANAHVYIVHLSSHEALNAALYQRKLGADVSIETCPHYLLLNDDKYNLGFESAKFVMSPPLRKKSDSIALWNALQNDIQTVSTDHCSFNFSGQKDLDRNNFTLIPNGIPSVEHRLKLLYSYGVQSGKITRSRFSELTATNPAKIFGLYPQKGIIAPGSDADLIVIQDSNINDKISAASQFQNVDYSPYENFLINCQINMVFLRGECVFQNSRIIKQCGQFLPR